MIWTLGLILQMPMLFVCAYFRFLLLSYLCHCFWLNYMYSFIILIILLFICILLPSSALMILFVLVDVESNFIYGLFNVVIVSSSLFISSEKSTISLVRPYRYYPLAVRITSSKTIGNNLDGISLPYLCMCLFLLQFFLWPIVKLLLNFRTCPLLGTYCGSILHYFNACSCLLCCRRPFENQ